MTRLAGRLGAFLTAAPGRPSILETAALAMFSIAGCPPLVAVIGPGPAGVQLDLDPQAPAPTRSVPVSAGRSGHRQGASFS